MTSSRHQVVSQSLENLVARASFSGDLLACGQPADSIHDSHAAVNVFPNQLIPPQIAPDHNRSPAEYVKIQHAMIPDNIRGGPGAKLAAADREQNRTFSIIRGATSGQIRSLVMDNARTGNDRTSSALFDALDMSDVRALDAVPKTSDIYGAINEKSDAFAP